MHLTLIFNYLYQSKYSYNCPVILTKYLTLINKNIEEINRSDNITIIESYFEIATAGKIVYSLIMIFKINIIPCASKNSIDQYIDRNIVGITIFIAIHAPNYTLSSTN